MEDRALLLVDLQDRAVRRDDLARICCWDVAAMVAAPSLLVDEDRLDMLKLWPL